MMVNGYYNDGEVKMLYSIMVKVMKGERVLELGPVSGGTRVCPPQGPVHGAATWDLQYNFKLYGSGLM